MERASSRQGMIIKPVPIEALSELDWYMST